MSSRSATGKREWKQRAPQYASELRAAIEQQAGRPKIERRAATRFAGWLARGRLPLWLRIKQRLRGAR